MELKRTSIDLNLYGDLYKLRKVKVGEATEYSKKVNECETDEEKTEALYGLLEQVGLPRSVCMEIEYDHLLQIVEEVMPAKKK